MKKITLLLALCLASFTAVHAQDGPIGTRSSTDYAPSTSDSRNNGFGVKGGFNLSNVRGDDKDIIPSRENYNAFHFGFYGQFGLNDKVSIQPEFLYSRKGFRYTEGGEETTNRFDYLQVPVLFVYNFVDNVSFHIGPQVSVMTKYKNGDEDLNIADSGLNSLDYGAVAGLEGRLGPARVGVRYDLGLGKLAEDEPNKLYNNTFQVYLGIGFTN